jgi:hypothetical protein
MVFSPPPFVYSATLETQPKHYKISDIPEFVFFYVAQNKDSTYEIWAKQKKGPDVPLLIGFQTRQQAERTLEVLAKYLNPGS